MGYDEAGVIPCRYWLSDGGLVPVSLDDLPSADWPGWEARYENDCERGKRTARDFAKLPPMFGDRWQELLGRNDGDLIGPDAHFDPTTHGGGLHVTDPGGWLSPHLDFAAHPKLPGWERRLNVIAFLNPEWRDEWGGAFCLYNPGGEVVKRFNPAPGRVIAFECGDLAYHGVEPITGPVPRVTLAAYYLAPVRPGVTRQRALFFPNRGRQK
jgi:hypothetical protein